MTFLYLCRALLCTANGIGTVIFELAQLFIELAGDDALEETIFSALALSKLEWRNSVTNHCVDRNCWRVHFFMPLDFLFKKLHF